MLYFCNFRNLETSRQQRKESGDQHNKRQQNSDAQLRAKDVNHMVVGTRLSEPWDTAHSLTQGCNEPNVGGYPQFPKPYVSHKINRIN